MTMTTRAELDELRVLVRLALLTKQVQTLDAVAFAAGLLRQNEDYERISREELAVAPHDVQVYWLGECNCDGHQN